MDVDKVEFEGFSWFTMEMSFIWYRRINKNVSFRYGAGLGLGLISGGVYRTDAVCSLGTCVTVPGGMQHEKEDDIPPIFPVLNTTLGFQFHPEENIAINIEAGLHTTLFMGMSSSYFF